MKKYLLIINSSIIVISLLYGVFSGNLWRNFNSSQEGQRIYIALNIQFKDRILYKESGFRYLTIKMRLNGQLDMYKDFILKYKYIGIGNDRFCKNDNLISLKENLSNIEFQYEHDSEECRERL